MSKILSVFIRENFNSTYDSGESYKFRVSDSFEVKVGDVVIIDPKYREKINLSLGVVDFIEQVDDDSIINNRVYGDNDKIYTPFFISTLALDEYVKVREKVARKNQLEKQLSEATKKLEKAAKYKALADLNPEWKPLYEEYVSLVTEDNKKLLD